MKITDFVLEFKIFKSQRMPIKYKVIQNKVMNLEIRNDDLWLCCSPKTNWLNTLKILLQNNFLYSYIGSASGVVIGF